MDPKFKKTASLVLKLFAVAALIYAVWGVFNSGSDPFAVEDIPVAEAALPLEADSSAETEPPTDFSEETPPPSEPAAEIPPRNELPAQSQATAPAEPSSPPAEAPLPVEEIEKDRRLMVFYFHTSARCYSCVVLENYTSEALRAHFPIELATERILWRPVNVEAPQNQHFIRDFQLYSKSVILADFVDGELVGWENLERVWQLLGNKTAFMNYIRERVGSHIQEDGP